MSNTTNFILIMIMVQILIVSYSITSAIRDNKTPLTNSTEITDIKKEPTTLDVLSGNAERIYVDSPDIESCKTVYPYGYSHIARNGNCSFIVWKNVTGGFQK